MKQTIKKISWVIIGLIPVIFWLELYYSSTTEYDENLAHLFLAVLFSIVNVALLIYVRTDFSNQSTLKRVIRIYSIILGTPLTFGFIIIYLQTISMNFVSTSAYTKGPNGGETYLEEKRRNYFKAENTLILDNRSAHADTIKAVVTRSGELEKLVHFRNGQESTMEISELDKLTKKQREKLIVY